MKLEPAAVRHWLIKRPRPDGVKLTFADNDTKWLPRTNEQSWTEIADTICALEPVLVEACKADSTVIRAAKADDLGKEDRARDNSRVAPPAALHTDPETARMCYVADLLHRAYQHSTDVAFEKVCAAYDSAFQRLVDLTEKIGERSDAIERRLERTEVAYRHEVNERLQDAIERAEEQGEGGVAEFIRNFVGGVNAGEASRSNGKAKA